MWLLALVGCDYLYERFIDAPKAPEERHDDAPVVIAPPRPIPPPTDSRPPPPASPVSSDDCKDLPDGGDVDGPDCLSGVIRCDQTLVGHTKGGVREYDTRFYESHHCTPATTDHDGGDERVYRLDVPDGDWVAFVTLHSPCADLDVAAYPWSGEDCPPIDDPRTRCEMNRMNGKKSERLVLVSQSETSWYIIVEGEGEDEGLFGLSVQCRPGLY